MKRYLIPLVLLAFALSVAAQTMRTVNDTNEMVMLNPQTINTNLFVHVMPPLKGSVWTFIAGDTTGPDTNHLDSVLYPGLGRWVWNNIGTNYFETLIVSNLVAGGDSQWTNKSGILQPVNLTLPVMLTNRLSFSEGMTNVLTRSNSFLVYTNGDTSTRIQVNNGTGKQSYIGTDNSGSFFGTTGVSSSWSVAGPLTYYLSQAYMALYPAVDNNQDIGYDLLNLRAVHERTNYVYAYHDALQHTNTVRLESSMNGPQMIFDITSKTNNVNGPITGYSFRTNGIQLASFSGGAGGDFVTIYNGGGATAQFGLGSGGTGLFYSSSGTTFTTDELITHSLRPNADDTYTLGQLNASSGRWLYSNVTTNIVTGFENTSANYSRLNISQPGTNSPVILDQVTGGTAGYSRGFDFRTNGVSLFTITGTGGPSSAANWTAVGATDSSLAGTATATNGYTTAEGGTIAFTNDVKLLRDSANTLALRNGTSAQAFRVYNTWANSGTDYERGVLDWITTPNSFTIGTEMGGTGQSRSVQFRQGGTNIFYIDAATGALLWNVNARNNIGAAGGLSPNNIYAAGRVEGYSVVSDTAFITVGGSLLSSAEPLMLAGNGFQLKGINLGTASVLGGITRVLTNSALSDFLYISVPNTNAIGGKVIWTLTSTDGTDTQQITGETKFGAVAKATTVTATLADVQCPAAIAGGGTLTAVIASNVTTNNVFALGVTPTSSLTTTNILFRWRLETPSVYTVNAL